MEEQIKPELAESNKIIAQFMGWKEMPTQRKDWMLTEIIEGSDCAKMQKSLSQMKFSTSWNWLMPVIEKISNLEIKFLNADRYFNPYPITFGMQNEDGLFMFRFYAHSLHSHQNLIDAAYGAVVEFLTGHMKGGENGNV